MLNSNVVFMLCDQSVERVSPILYGAHHRGRARGMGQYGDHDNLIREIYRIVEAVSGANFVLPKRLVALSLQRELPTALNVQRRLAQPLVGTLHGLRNLGDEIVPFALRSMR